MLNVLENTKVKPVHLERPLVDDGTKTKFSNSLKISWKLEVNLISITIKSPTLGLNSWFDDTGTRGNASCVAKSYSLLSAASIHYSLSNKCHKSICSSIQGRLRNIIEIWLISIICISACLTYKPITTPEQHSTSIFESETDQFSPVMKKMLWKMYN